MWLLRQVMEGSDLIIGWLKNIGKLEIEWSTQRENAFCISSQFTCNYFYSYHPFGCPYIKFSTLRVKIYWLNYEPTRFNIKTKIIKP